MKTEHITILAIETSAKIGSLSLCRKTAEGDFSRKTTSLHRSDEVATKLEALLVETGIGRNEIGRIIVSKGPGSLTGIRNGRAFAKGLADALGVDLDEVEIPDLLAKLNRQWSRYFFALDVGRKEVIVQRYGSAKEQNSIVDEHGRQALDYNAFQNFLTALTDSGEGLIVPEDLIENSAFTSLSERLRENEQLIVCAQPLAALMAHVRKRALAENSPR